MCRGIWLVGMDEQSFLDRYEQYKNLPKCLKGGQR